MQLIELKESEKEIYNRFVASAETGSFLQSWEWGEWQEQLGRQVARFEWRGLSGEIIGSIQFIKMLLPFGRYYLYCPYGPVVIGNYESLGQDLQSKFPNAVFIRIEPKFGLPAIRYPLFAKSANIQPAKTLVIDLTKSEEQMLAEMHPKTRYNIRLAQKHGVNIQDEFGISIGNGLFTKEAVELIVKTSRRQGYKGYGAEYYEKMIDFLALQKSGDLKLHIYKAIYYNQLLASGIYLDFGKTRTFLFGGSLDENKNIMAPYLMHFKAMLDAKAIGLLTYDFWGVETSKGEVPGFVRFKLGFAPQSNSGSTRGIKEYPGAYDLIVDSFGYSLYKIFRKIKRLL